MHLSKVDIESGKTIHGQFHPAPLTGNRPKGHLTVKAEKRQVRFIVIVIPFLELILHHIPWKNLERDKE